jgi:hypothetical protein
MCGPIDSNQLDPFDSPADREEFAEFVEEVSLDSFGRQLLEEVENDIITYLTLDQNN